MGGSFGQTAIPSPGGFIPYCTDFYLNEDRVMKDFRNFMQENSKPHHN
jgi:hypothetical protein